MATARRQYTHAQREKVLVQTRRQEEKREDTLRCLANDRVLDANMGSSEKVEDKRYILQMQQEQRELQMEEAMITAERDRIVRAQQIEQEERLASELDRLKTEKLKDEKMRQHVRETSLELRELEGKLKAAYMNKERAAQLAEKDAIKYDEMARDGEIARQMKDENQRAAVAEQQKEVENYKEQVRHQQELERQLEEKESAKQQEYEEFLKEKLMVDEIVRKIYEEDQREREMQLNKRKATQEFIEEFKHARSQWKDEESARMVEENKRILEFSHVQEDRETKRMTERKHRDEKMQQVQSMLSEKIARDSSEREEMERVMMELKQEEQEEMSRMKEREEMEKKIRQRIELQMTHAQQMQFKSMRKQAEIEEEEEYKRQMMAKFAEDDKIEQMNAQKRRMKQQEHKRAVEDLLDNRRQQNVADKEQNEAVRQQEAMMEAMRKQIIEEERQRLLKEHATKLLGYLPKGVFLDEKDLHLLGDEFKDEYTRRRPDSYEQEFL